MRDDIKKNNLNLLGVREKDSMNDIKIYSDIGTENFPSTEKEFDIEASKAYIIWNSHSQKKKNSPRYIMVKILEI